MENKEDEIVNLIADKLRNLDIKQINLIISKVLDKFSHNESSVGAGKQEYFNLLYILNQMPFPIAISKDENTNYFINNKFTELYGYSIEDIPNERTWMKKAYPDPKYLKEINAEYNSPNFSRYLPYHRKISCKNNKIRYAILQDIDVLNKKFTFFQDITELKFAEANIISREREYNEIYNSSRDMIIFIDTNLCIQRFNPATTKIFGYTEEQVKNKPIFKFILPEYHALIKTTISNKSSRDNGAMIYEMAIRKENGDIINTESFSKSIFREGKFYGILAIIRDTSMRERFTAERLRQQKLESIELLTGGLAHDFNNILVSIMGNISLLQLDEDNFNTEQKEILTDLERATGDAGELAKQLLTFSRGGSPTKKTIIISEFIKNSANFITRGTKCKCEFQFQEKLPSIEVDAGQINQVINNLLINAIQAMPNGGNIQVSAIKEKINYESIIPLIPGEYLKIIVKDRGLGIPKNTQQRIFDPYFTTKLKGNGLGLATSYSIIKKHHGHITFSSKVGEGTSFFIYLPFQQN